MAATGFTPVYIYASGTTGNIPSASNLTNTTNGSEIALNYFDGKLFYKNASNSVVTVPLLQSSGSQNGWLSSTDWTTFNNKSPAAGSSSITTVGTITSGTWNGSTIDIAHGGTNATSFNAPVSSVNGLVYFDGTRLVNDASTSDIGYNASTNTFYANTASVTNSVTGASFIPTSSTVPTNGMYLSAANTVAFATNSTFRGLFGSAGFSVNTTTQNGACTVASSYSSTGAPTSGNATVWLMNDGGSVLANNGSSITFTTRTRGTPNEIQPMAALKGAKLNANDDEIAGYLAFYTSNNSARTLVEQMRLWNTGGVSIGNTTDPGAANLSVTGSATIQGLTVGKGASAVATNSAFGVSALQAVTTGANNSGIGYQAGYNIQGGTENACFGSGAGYSTTSGSSNTFIGTYAGYTNSTSSNSVAVGDGAAYSMTGGSNTALGTSAANNLTSGTNNTAIGYAAGNSSGVINLTTQSNRVVIGDSNITNAYILVAWTVTSDARDKANVKPSPYGLDFVNKLNPISYQWDKRVNYQDGVPDGSKIEDKTYLGFLAQDVVELEKEFGGQSGNLLIADDEMEESLKITETKMIPVLVKALQELNAKFEAYVATHP